MRQLALGRVHHAVDLAGHHANRGLHARIADLDVHEKKQVAHMPRGTVAMQALEAADRPAVIGLEVGGAAVCGARVFLYPGASDVVLAIAQRRLVKAAVAQGDKHAVLLGARYPDRVAVTRALLRGARSRSRGASGGCHLQLKTIDELLDRIAQRG